MANSGRDSTIRTTAHWLGGAAVALLAVACGTLPSPFDPPTETAATPHSEAPPSAEVETAPMAATESGEFIVPARRITVWNAVGQILIRLHGVTYKDRSQKLAIYAVEYRGEEFLIETRGLAIVGPTGQVSTRVSAILLHGKRDYSPAATELLGILQQRLPAELTRLAADEEYRKLLAL